MWAVSAPSGFWTKVKRQRTVTHLLFSLINKNFFVLAANKIVISKLDILDTSTMLHVAMFRFIW